VVCVKLLGLVVVKKREFVVRSGVVLAVTDNNGWCCCSRRRWSLTDEERIDEARAKVFIFGCYGRGMEMERERCERATRDLRTVRGRGNRELLMMTVSGM